MKSFDCVVGQREGHLTHKMSCSGNFGNSPNLEQLQKNWLAKQKLKVTVVIATAAVAAVNRRIIT